MAYKLKLERLNERKYDYNGLNEIPMAQIVIHNTKKIAEIENIIKTEITPTNTPDDNALYWLSCIFCNCCCLGLIAFIMHFIAKSFYEEGKQYYGISTKLQKKARKFRLFAFIIGIIIFLLCIIWLPIPSIGIYPHNPPNGNSTNGPLSKGP